MTARTVPYEGDNFANYKMDHFSFNNFLKTDWNFFNVNTKQWEIYLKVKKLAKTTMFKKAYRPSTNVPLIPIFKALCPALRQGIEVCNKYEREPPWWCRFYRHPEVL